MSCGCVEERFTETNDDGTSCEKQTCQNLVDEQWCGWEMVAREIGATLMAPLAGKDVKTNMDDAIRQRERLEKRGDDHWRREGRHEAIERERAILKKNGMEGTGGVR
jgi:hypothetical protein